MKFLCVACDEAMKLKETRGPDDGSLTVLFGCPRCGREIAMLTNAMETQMVRALNVKIGPNHSAESGAEPMSTIRSWLAYGEDLPTAPPDSATPQERETAGKCPFTGVLEEAYAKKADELEWTAEAEERLLRIPEFVRPMVKKSIEQHARDKGHTRIDAAVMDEVKGQFGM